MYKSIKFFLGISLIIVTTVNIFANTEIRNFKLQKNKLKLYEPLFVDIKLAKNYNNPFDTFEIQMDAIIINDKGDKIIQPCFYLKSLDADIDLWQLRFTPMKIGKYTIQIRIREGKNFTFSKKKNFIVVESKNYGFLRKSTKSYYLFQFDSGKIFRGIGINFCWEDKKYSYEKMFKILNQNKVNFVRIWMAPWNLALEWKKYGLNRYDMAAANRLDEIIKLAEQYNIYIMLTIDYHGILSDKKDFWGSNDEWKNNPYNKICSKPIEYLTKFEAKETYKKRLRYIISRWGYSTHIAVWELWNEINNVVTDANILRKWHQEMTKYIKKIDVHKHLVSTSSDELGGIWDIKELDFSQSHLYGSSINIPATIKEYEKNYKKPHIVGEFAYSWQGPKKDEYGYSEVLFHNGLWDGIFSPTPVTPMTWWWDIFEPIGLFKHLKNVGYFWNNVVKNKIMIQPLSKKIRLSIAYLKKSKNDVKKDLVILPTKGFGKNMPVTVNINSSGIIENLTSVPIFLFGNQKKELRNPPVFKINYLNDGEFLVLVGDVSSDNNLNIWVDGKLVLNKPLQLGPGHGEWEKSVYKKEWKIYQGTYNKLYGIKIKSGKHTIKVENSKGDWIQIKKYIFRNSGINSMDGLVINSFTTESEIFIKLKSFFYNAKFIKEKGKLKPIKDIILKVDNIFAKNVSVKTFDTFKGKIIKNKNFRIENNKLQIHIPEIIKDIIYIIKIK